MKNLLTILLIIVALSNAKAQRMLSGGHHVSQSELHKFEGKWTYADDSTRLTIELRNDKVHVKRGTDDFYIDLIQGDYALVKSGKIIHSSSGKDTTITSGSFDSDDKNRRTIHFIFADEGRQSKRCNVIFELLAGGPNKAHWVLTNTEHIVVGNEHYDPTFSVPTNMILTKVN
ncbi:DUF6705 family protein [Mucilaginibacter flavidus]|uniref:DUF6705 family protein n=1 Tax=Mucilaginibacter flavidus TaxID=2949309 RepID=UPI002092C879|nr:DUF6705 family protein [Mucilaginibacter flavidus]MCO5946715.1 hypothetical protein [Mucilaginibacter flavidus]